MDTYLVENKREYLKNTFGIRQEVMCLGRKQPYCFVTYFYLINTYRVLLCYLDSRDMIVNQTIFYHVASGFAMDFLWCDVTIIMVNEARIRDENIRSTVVFFGWIFQDFEDYLKSSKLETSRQLLTNCIYLQDSSLTICGIKIYGSPWSVVQHKEFWNHGTKQIFLYSSIYWWHLHIHL